MPANKWRKSIGYDHFIIPKKTLELDNDHQWLRKLLNEKLMGIFKPRQNDQY